MGYTKIVQYGDIVEVYQYDKDLVNSRTPSRLNAHRLANGVDNPVRRLKYSNVAEKRKKALRATAIQKNIYKRSKASLRRSKTNFFRLTHHNNCLADSIHFLTLTFAYDLSYETANRHVKRFMERVRKHTPEISVDYISVPELTENGRFHFHLLVYNLPARLAGNPIKTNRQKNAKFTTERATRNLQVLFERGYVDIVPATYTSVGIAGYMAKYMAKSLSDSRYVNRRGYTCSRGVEKVRSSGSNSLNQFSDLIVPTVDIETVDNREYNVPYLGTCAFKKIKILK